MPLPQSLTPTERLMADSTSTPKNPATTIAFSAPIFFHLVRFRFAT
jgi:hypothetical protein